ncbi:MAG: hypothetical protein FWD15_05275 [Alphaproteobacteria bacterium]|nr:hypothetical protein [Alphaproteobacteria bacterium]
MRVSSLALLTVFAFALEASAQGRATTSRNQPARGTGTTAKATTGAVNPGFAFNPYANIPTPAAPTFATMDSITRIEALTDEVFTCIASVCRGDVEYSNCFGGATEVHSKITMDSTCNMLLNQAADNREKTAIRTNVANRVNDIRTSRCENIGGSIQNDACRIDVFFKPVRPSDARDQTPIPARRQSFSVGANVQCLPNLFGFMPSELEYKLKDSAEIEAMKTQQKIEMINQGVGALTSGVQIITTSIDLSRMNQDFGGAVCDFAMGRLTCTCYCDEAKTKKAKDNKRRAPCGPAGENRNTCNARMFTTTAAMKSCDDSSLLSFEAASNPSTIRCRIFLPNSSEQAIRETENELTRRFSLIDNIGVAQARQNVQLYNLVGMQAQAQVLQQGMQAVSATRTEPVSTTQDTCPPGSTEIISKFITTRGTWGDQQTEVDRSRAVSEWNRLNTTQRVFSGQCAPHTAGGWECLRESARTTCVLKGNVFVKVGSATAASATATTPGGYQALFTGQVCVSRGANVDPTNVASVRAAMRATGSATGCENLRNRQGGAMTAQVCPNTPSGTGIPVHEVCWMNVSYNVFSAITEPDLQAVGFKRNAAAGGTSPIGTAIAMVGDFQYLSGTIKEATQADQKVIFEAQRTETAYNINQARIMEHEAREAGLQAQRSANIQSTIAAGLNVGTQLAFGKHLIPQAGTGIMTGNCYIGNPDAAGGSSTFLVQEGGARRLSWTGF